MAKKSNSSSNTGLWILGGLAVLGVGGFIVWNASTAKAEAAENKKKLRAALDEAQAALQSEQEHRLRAVAAYKDVENAYRGLAAEHDEVLTVAEKMATDLEKLKAVPEEAQAKKTPQGLASSFPLRALNLASPTGLKPGMLGQP